LGLVFGCAALVTRQNNLLPQALLLLLFVCLTADLGTSLVIRSASSELQETVEELQATVAQLTQQLNEQAAQIQRVSAQIEASKPAPQVVNNP